MNKKRHRERVQRYHERKRWARNKEVAEYLGVTDVTVWNWRHNPSLNFPVPAEVNGKPYHDLDAIDEWMKSRVPGRASV